MLSRFNLFVLALIFNMSYFGYIDVKDLKKCVKDPMAKFQMFIVDGDRKRAVLAWMKRRERKYLIYIL